MAELQKVFHFDINGTVTIIDSTEEAQGDDYINLTMAKSIYGKVIDNQWIINDDIYDMKDSMKYRDYLLLVKLQESTAYSFAKDFKLEHIFDKINSLMHKPIFDSFTSILKKYPDAKLVFRTFGNDGPLIINTLKQEHSLDNLNLKEWKFFKMMYPYENCDDYKLKNDDCEIIGQANINQYILENSCNICITDNYHNWNSHEKNPEWGKPFFSDEKMLQIFFDDNLCVNLVDKLSNEYNNAHICKVNTIRALTEPDYYVKMVDKITNYFTVNIYKNSVKEHTFVLNYDVSDKVSMIKDHVYNKYGYIHNEQKLLFVGMPILDGGLINEYKSMATKNKWALAFNIIIRKPVENK